MLKQSIIILFLHNFFVSSGEILSLHYKSKLKSINMIIYGSKATTINSTHLIVEKCSNCQTQGSIIIGVYSKYAHIFWIPMFPIGKVGLSQCEHCKQVLKVKEMPADIKSQYHQLSAQSKVPMWQFAGLLIVGLIIVYSIITGNVEKKNEKQYLQIPLSGDVYEFKTKLGNYSTWILKNVTKDSLGISLNNYAITKSTGFYKIEKPENYSDSIVWISKADVSKMYSEGRIYSILRNK
jgi:hypothetical protein